jgi:DNA mismatch repair protein MutS
MAHASDLKRLIIDEYLDLHRELISKKYGSKNIVLMQNGMFYEIYNYRCVDGPDLFAIADLLSCQIGRKSKNIEEVTRNNYEMIGFPMHAQQKFISILLQNGYTIAVYNQEENGKKNVSRYLDQIISPSTTIDYCNQLDNNFLMSIYLEPHKNQKDEFYIAAYSLIDLSIGINYVNETGSRYGDYQYGIDKLYQTIKIYNPKEIICHVNKTHLINAEWVYNREQLISDLEIQIDGRTFHYYENEIDNKIYKLSYQNQFLGSVFQNHGMLDPISYVDLEKFPNAIISYIILLEFAKSHRLDIIQKISKPQMIDNQETLILTQNSIQQLNIIPDKNLMECNSRNMSLLSILNQCCTAFGKRQFRQKLLNPIISTDTLEIQYNKIESMINNNIYNQIEDRLSKILDIERLHRRMALRILTPNEMYNLYNSSKNIIYLFKYIDEMIPYLMPDISIINDYNKFIQSIQSNLKLDRIYKYNINSIERSIFIEGINTNIDILDNEIECYYMAFSTLAIELSKYIDIQNIKKKQSGKIEKKLVNSSNIDNVDSCESNDIIENADCFESMEQSQNLISINNNDRDGVYLETTKKRAEIIKQKIAGKTIEFTIEIGNDGSKVMKSFSINSSDIEFRQVSSTSSNVRIVGKIINAWSKKIDEKTKRMINMASDLYVSILETIDKQYNQLLQKIVGIVGEIDIIKTHAQNAVELNLVRPIISNSQEQSYFKAEGLRHPIVEKVQTKTPFIANDLHLGIDNQNQILCYGYNAVGKTTMQKAICIAIIMAQSGGFVSASQFTFKPYHYIFTRISNVDNILKSQSSFMVEMLELKYILKHANKNSLVCIDELVASTERFSGISLVCATIKELHKRKSSMFMATHLHELSSMGHIIELPNLKIYHLEVQYDENTHSLIYDRKLRNGSGTGLYGLEVARFLDLDKGFMNDAFEIRNELLGKDTQVFAATHSNYNSDVYLYKCAICAYKPILNTDIPLETHHIHFQSCADSLGNFKQFGFHKNVEHNLVCLCRNCHTQVHNNLIDIKGYISTSSGIVLDYNKNEIPVECSQPTKSIVKNIGRRKLDPDQIKIVQDLLISNHNKNANHKNILNKKLIITELNIKHGIQIDYKILSKIQNNTY